MPAYDAMLTPDLKLAMAKIGARPVGKKRMRELLTHVYRETHQYETDSDCEGTPLKRPRLTDRDDVDAHSPLPLLRPSTLSLDHHDEVTKSKITKSTTSSSKGGSSKSSAATMGSAATNTAAAKSSLVVSLSQQQQPPMKRVAPPAKKTASASSSDPTSSSSSSSSSSGVMTFDPSGVMTFDPTSADPDSDNDSNYSDGPDLPEESILQVIFGETFIMLCLYAVLL